MVPHPVRPEPVEVRAKDAAAAASIVRVSPGPATHCIRRFEPGRPRDHRSNDSLSSPAPESGFSLIEALVALAILAIATVGLVRTVETHIDSTRALEGRQAAMWVAENRLAELEAGIAGSDRAEMLGRDWRIAVAERATDDPAIRRVRIDVYDMAGPPGASPLASLDGFVDARDA